MMPPLPTEKLRMLQAEMERTPPAAWIVEMVRHYQRTGNYRPEDLRRLLGAPTGGVSVGPKAPLEDADTPS